MRQAGGIRAQLFEFSTERPSQQKARSADMHLDEHRDRLAAHRARLALSREHIGAVSVRELVPAGYGDVRLGVPMMQMEHVVPPPKVEVSSAMVGRAQPRWAPPPSVFPQLAPSQLGETTPGGRGYRNN